MKIIGCENLPQHIKRHGVWVVNLVVGFVTFGFFGCASRVAKPASAELPLTVNRLIGQARWKTGTNEWRPIVYGQAIHAGMLIETAQNSQVDLRIPAAPARAQWAETASSLNRTDLRHPDSQTLVSLHQRPYDPLVFRIWDNTRVAVSQIERSETKLRRAEIGKVILDLQAGHLFLSMAKLSSGAEFQVRMPACSASVHGTTFGVDVDGIVKVLAGSVLVTGTNFSQLVESQHMFDARTRVLSPLQPRYGPVCQ